MPGPFDFGLQLLRSLNPELIVGDRGGDSSCPETGSEPEAFCEEGGELLPLEVFGGLSGVVSGTPGEDSTRIDSGGLLGASAGVETLPFPWGKVVASDGDEIPSFSTLFVAAGCSCGPGPTPAER